MITRIKKAFIRNLPKLSWMDSKTRAAAVEKVSVEVMFSIFTARQHSCKRCTSYRKSVRPSVRLSVRLSVRHSLALCQNDSS